jgi:hypothetical protein
MQLEVQCSACGTARLGARFRRVCANSRDGARSHVSADGSSHDCADGSHDCAGGSHVCANSHVCAKDSHDSAGCYVCARILELGTRLDAGTILGTVIASTNAALALGPSLPDKLACARY